MRLLIFSGSHQRHNFVAQALCSLHLETCIIEMQREDVIPVPPKSILECDRANFERHFARRETQENLYFGKYRNFETSSNLLFRISKEELNSLRVLEIVNSFNPDVAFVFGTGLLMSRILNELPENTINLHLGLSPQYKGSATLFWPFYMLEPQFAGYTLHKITSKIDGGGIFHQGVPKLEWGDGIHDVSAKTVVYAAEASKKLIAAFANQQDLIAENQRKTGKLWLSSDFRPEHLRVIYDTYEDKLVDEYLLGNLGEKKPVLVESNFL